MKTIDVRAGEQKMVFKRFSSSIAETIILDVEPLNPDAQLAGILEIRGSSWIIPKKPVPMPLESHHEIEKGAMDSNFALWVKPDVDVRVTLPESKEMRRFWLIMLVALLAVLAGGLVIILSQMNQ